MGRPRHRATMARGRRSVALVLCAILIVGIGWRIDRRIEGSDQTTTGDSSTLTSPRPTVPSDLDGSKLLAAEVTTRDGERSTIGIAGDQRPLLVNFWAEWCAPCIAEMPIFEQARQRNPDVRFVGINEMDQLEKAEAMAGRTGITYDWYLDVDGSFAVAAETINLPTTILLDPDGSILATRVGAFSSPEELQRWLDGAAPGL